MTHQAPAPPLRIRSRFLAAPPQPPRASRWDRFLRIAVRWPLVAMLAAVGVWLVGGVFEQRFALDGWAWIFYVIHDHLYITAIGHLWTNFHPFSWAWFGATGLLLLGWLIGFLTGHSLYRAMHLRLARFAVRRPLWRPFLISWYRLTRGRFFQPRQLEAVVAHECQRALESLGGLFRSPGQRFAAGEYGRLVHLVRLRADLRLTPPRSRDDPVWALNLLFAAFVRLKIEAEAAGIAEGRDGLRQLAGSLLGLVVELHPQEPRRFERVLELKAGFDRRSLWGEVALLLLTEPTASRVSPGADRRRALWRVAAGVATRREKLDGWRSLLEQQVRGEAARIRPKRLDRVREVRPEPGVGELAMLLALEVAADPDGSEDLALAYLESVEGLIFAADAADALPREAMRSQLVTLARGLTDGAVDDHIYRLCAAVLSGQRAQHTRLMKGLQRIGEGIFTADDWQWLSEPIPALYQAAGENGHRNGTER